MDPPVPQCIPHLSRFLQQDCQQTFLNSNLPLHFDGDKLGKNKFIANKKNTQTPLNFSYFLDLLLHYLWNNKATLNITEPDYSTFVQNAFKYTARDLDTQQQHKKPIALLIRLVHKLQTNIIILGFKRITQFSKMVVHAETATQHGPKCMIPYYIFHHYLYSLKKKRTDTQQIVFCFHQHNLYLVTKVDRLTPVLTNLPSSSSVIFQNTCVSCVDVWNILHRQPVHFNFSVILHSGFEYHPQRFITHMKPNNIVGVYYCSTKNDPLQNIHNSQEHEQQTSTVSNNDEQLHLLLTPCLKNYQFYMTLITIPWSPKYSVNLHNNFATAGSFIPEGRKLKWNHPPDNHHEDCLDEEYCICQHPETQLFKKKRFPMPRQYNCLGINLF